ncbi:hypothetical protein C8Q77DRAFT_237447 [Trametes polyzona]|nr:hypothetical protein C8Q77DRAFT_237447 [Trametes polyzona]
MGFCFSCCRRRRAPRSKYDHESDREPLLPASARLHTPWSSDPLPPPKTTLEKVADVVAALNAGKLPSQEQLDGALRRVLASGVLDVNAGSPDEADGDAEEELEEAGRQVVENAREVCQALLQFGMEKNGERPHSRS